MPLLAVTLLLLPIKLTKLYFVRRAMRRNTEKAERETVSPNGAGAVRNQNEVPKETAIRRI